MVMVDQGGEIILANRALQQLFGYTSEDLLGKPIEMLVPHRFRPQHPGHRDSFFADPVARPLGNSRDLRGMHKNGSEISVEVGLTPVAMEQGVFALATVVDLTARKKAEERFRATVEAAPVGMVMIDQSGEILLVNAALERLFGYTREELLGQEIEILVPENARGDHPGHRTGFFADPTQRPMGAGRDLCGRHKSGAEIPVELGLTPINTESGIVALGTVVDLTASRNDAERIRNSNQALARSNSELEQFAYVASHDLQEPLRKIASYCQLLKEEQAEKLDDEGREYLDVAIDGSKRLLTLVRDLLSLSRVTTRGKPLAPISVHESLQEAMGNLELAIQERDAHVTADPLPNAMADQSQLTLLFQNLIGNAMKYCTARVPMVHIGVCDTGSQFEFSVQDNGIGIEPQYKDRVFQIFQRLHNRREYSGTGIGLALCRRIVERFGGEIWLESTPGRGSTFYFTLNKAVLQERHDVSDQHAKAIGRSDRNPAR